MKSILTKGLLAIAALTVLTTSCSKNEDTADEASLDLTAEQTTLSAEADRSADEVFNLIEIAYAEQEEEAGRTTSLFPDCVTITISSENEVTFVTYDFGLGCEIGSGAIVSGTLRLTYGPLVAATRTITFSFENFGYNNKGIAGGGTIYRERNNANGNPASTVNKDLQVTMQNGVVASVTGTRSAEWIEGFASGTWTDNVFLITGDRDIAFSSGFNHDLLVLEALRRESTCDYFVSGVLEVTRNNGTGTLDYGDGTCDNLAVLTINGQEYEITLD